MTFELAVFKNYINERLVLAVRKSVVRGHWLLLYCSVLSYHQVRQEEPGLYAFLR